jgi:ABC-type uncharacterized transport system ATPase component
MLNVTSLYQIYNPGSVNEVHALSGVNLHIPPKQFVTMIGSNGAGKTTLLNVIAGVYPPTRGALLSMEWMSPGGLSTAGRAWWGGSSRTHCWGRRHR